MAKPVRNALFRAPVDLASDEPCRLAGSAVVAAVVTGALVWGASMAAEWALAGQTGWLGGVTPEMGLGSHILYWSKAAMHAASRARPFDEDVSAYRAMLQEMSWWAVKGKAALAVVPSMLAGSVVLRKMWAPFTNTKHLTGIRFWSDDEALDQANRAVLQLNRGAKPFLPLHPAIAWLSEQVWSRSAVVFGSAGAGKSAMVAHILHAAQEANHHMVVIDIKGTQAWVLTEINRRLGRKSSNIAVISPFCDTDAVIDIGRDLTRDEDAAVFAASLIPKSDDPMWSDGARGVLRVIVLSLIHKYRAAKAKAAERGGPKPQPWHWGHLAMRVQAAMKDIYAWAEATDPMVAAMIADYERSATVRSFEIQMRAFATSLVNMGKAWGDDPPNTTRRRISLRSFVTGMDKPGYRGPRQIVLRGNEEYEDFAKGYLRFVLDFIAKTALSLPDNPSSGGRNLILALDEFISLGRLESILKILEKGRSKGIKTILAFQSQAALKSTYGEDDAKRIVGTTYLKIIGLAGDAAIANELAAPYGTRLVRKTRPGPMGPNGTPTAPVVEEVDEVVLRPEILSSAAQMGPQKATSRVPAGVKAIVRVGDDLFHLQWPFASPDKVPQPGADARYKLAGWMTGENAAPLTDYSPHRERPKGDEQVVNGADADTVTGNTDTGPTTENDLRQEQDRTQAVTTTVKKPKLSELLEQGMANAGTTLITETVMVDAQRGSAEYTNAGIDAANLQQAQEQRGEWREPGESDEAGSIVLELLTGPVLDGLLPGASIAMEGLKIAEGLQAPATNIEQVADANGEIRNVPVIAPKVASTVQTRVKIQERDREHTPGRR